MRNLLKKYSSPIVIMGDVLIIPFIFACKGFLGVLIEKGKPCKWTLYGAKCGACGGTHCVQSLFEGDIWGAFLSNPIIFLCIVYLLLTVILLNLVYVLKVKKLAKLLKSMYTEKTVFIILGMFIVYTILRNIPLYISWFS